MLNSISLVGKIVKNVYHVENMAFIDIEVKRPFPEEIGKEKFDVFSIALWKGLEDMMSDVAQIGSPATGHRSRCRKHCLHCRKNNVWYST